MFLIAVSRREIPDALIERHGLKPSRRHADADEEIIFRRTLPVWLDGQIVILPWAGWTDEPGGELVLIPATFGCDGGIWFAITGGLRGVIRSRKVYLLFQPATHYYEVMTRNKRMPAFASGTI